MSRLSIRRLEGLPPLAWLADIDSDRVNATVGRSVRLRENGFFEGTWVGPADFDAIPSSTTVFGSGVIMVEGRPVIVPPSHPLERLYLYRRGQRLLASNSLVWLLRAAKVQLDPAVLYPPLFLAASLFVNPPLAEIPTTNGPVTLAVYDNFGLTDAGEIDVISRPLEKPFESFADFRERLSAALASARDNAPGYEMAVSLSSGYDSTAVAAVAAPLGCRRALTFAEGKPVRGSESLSDSGAASAKTLGMSVESFDRQVYRARTDLPEAEFLATGMSGEDVVMAAMEGSLRRTLLLSGSESFRLKGNPFRPGLHRGDMSSSSLTEFRLRLDFVHVPILFLGASEQPSLTRIIDSEEMQPYVVAGRYDKPIQRRLVEDAGIQRGSFAAFKRRASATLHSEGLAAMSASSVSSLTAFGAAEGTEVVTPRRFVVRRWHRFVLRYARTVHLDPLVAPLRARQRALTQFEPEFGSLLLRWAVNVVWPRYDAAFEPHPQEHVRRITIPAVPACRRPLDRCP